MYMQNTNSSLIGAQFVTPFRGYNLSKPLTVLEQSIKKISAEIRQKKDWKKKINDETILDKWKNELTITSPEIANEVFSYIIDELNYLARSSSDGSIELSAVDGVWQSDIAIPNEIRMDLYQCVQKLENQGHKDWHPDSNQKILDLVHPSLYCLVNGVSQLTKEPIPLSGTKSSIGKGDVYFWEPKTHSHTFSNKYQWLPCELDVMNDGSVEIVSYINNLDPVLHGPLYSTIEKIFSCFVPMFNQVLTDLANFGLKTPIINVEQYNWYESLEQFKKSDLAAELRQNFFDEDQFGIQPGQQEYDSDIERDDYFVHRRIKLPSVGKFQPPKMDNHQLIDIRGHRLQVIVKLANIELTPEKPRYDGGIWHVEGSENEEIVSTGIYYYDQENVTESYLKFRQAIDDPYYEQNDHRGVELIYGLLDDGPLNQNLGRIKTIGGRCIVFPNIYQHCVSPFELVDHSKPGHRKILVFFLVDPTKKIISTANVAPQQSIIPLMEAEKYRLDLMAERKYFMKENNKELYERPFSLCEH